MNVADDEPDEVLRGVVALSLRHASSSFSFSGSGSA
jgi:hypothetical protein